MKEKDGRFEAEDPAGPTRRSGADHRREFASAIARAEFGRFYWNDDLERKRREASGRKQPAKAARPSK